MAGSSSSATSSLDNSQQQDLGEKRIGETLTISYTADDTNGSIPTISSLTFQSSFLVKAVHVVGGTTVDALTVKVHDDDKSSSLDLASGKIVLTNADSQVYLKDDNGATPIYIGDTSNGSISFTGNTTNDATGTIYLEFVYLQA